MVFKCQEDSFLTEFTSTVIKCEPTKEPIVNYGKVSEFEGFQVTLENTILFPAGGGQPHDIGWLSNVEVVQVLRKGGEALHFTKEPLAEGTVVTQKIDWNRRFDHMQQHSGQHLLSAILEQKHNLPTTSWWLGADESYVELNSTNVPNDIITQVENECNELIRQALPVTVKICRIDDPELNEAHTRGLPKDCMDTIRIIQIGNIDENMCCGTHVSNLSQLQAIKLLGCEPGKKGKTNLRFLVGNRLMTSMQLMLDRQRELTGLLKHPDRYDRRGENRHRRRRQEHARDDAVEVESGSRQSSQLVSRPRSRSQRSRSQNVAADHAPIERGGRGNGRNRRGRGRVGRYRGRGRGSLGQYYYRHYNTRYEYYNTCYVYNFHFY